MADVINPEEQPEEEEPEEDDKTKFLRKYRKILEWKPPKNEYELTETSFDVSQAWEALLTLPTCQEMMIKESNQKLLNLVVGVNVTQEFPWKHVTYRNLRDHCFDDLSNGQLLHNAFQGYNLDSSILIGYVPLITQDMEEPPSGDPFVLYVNPEDAKLALAIIRNMETFERMMINIRLIKQPRRWISHGSEDEVNLTIAQRYHDPVDVEIQSVYPLTIPAKKDFEFRLSNDVRDGYVELIPSENACFENVSRRRITVGIQASFPRINIEQQTDPTFPTNAWAQYLYEINEEEDRLDEGSEEEEAKETKAPSSKPVTPEPPKGPKPPPEVSENVKLLLKVLEFNQIDMYRNDYPYITDKNVRHYTSPYLEETLCFANISKSNQRYVCGFDWYPSLSGLIVTSYSFTTPATTESINTEHNLVKRSVLQQKPILMWSFNDNLNYKLEFESPLEVVVLSFCPHDENVLLGGATNGQVILWDLQNRVQKMEFKEMLTSAQIFYRVAMNEFLKWTVQINEDILVAPATISRLENCQKSTITNIYWMSSNCYVNLFGKVIKDPVPDKKYRYFMTCSLDGSIAFWNLDAEEGKSVSSGLRRDLPKQLTQSESLYKGRVLKPVFTVAFSQPITALIADTPVYKCKLKDHHKPDKNCYNYALENKEILVSDIRQSCIISTMYGRIERISWLGQYSDGDGREVVNSSTNFALVHDGPIISMKRNPFLPWLFISIGRNVLAIWKEDYHYSPIIWRKRKCDLTSVAWSESRPSVFFLTRNDGSLEAWDLLARDDEACVDETLGGGIVTNICEHKLPYPEKLLGIGDYNSSLRMVKLPKSLYDVFGADEEEMKNYILKEESRKKAIQAWEQKYYEKNKVFIEAKLNAELEAHKEIERLEKEALQKANRKAKEEEEAKKLAEPSAKISYTERMKKQWYDLNLKRLLDILMSRKRVNEKQLNEQTVLEKERLAYEQAKKTSLAEVLRKVSEEVASVRLFIYPQEIPDFQRMDMIQDTVKSILQSATSLDAIELEANNMINEFDSLESISYSEFLHRGQQRRKLLNKSLGGNTERWYWYENLIKENLISDGDWGLEIYADLLQNTDVGSLPPSELDLVVKTEEEKEKEEENLRQEEIKDEGE